MAVLNTNSTYVNNIQTFFRNVTLNALGIERDFYQLMDDKDVHHALNMCEDNSTDVENALSEYNPQLHKVMRTPNKYPSGRAPYITCKHPRTRQRYINEVELFFLLGSPIKWKKEEGDDFLFYTPVYCFTCFYTSITLVPLSVWLFLYLRQKN